MFSLDGYLTSPSSTLSWTYPQHQHGSLPPYQESFQYERVVTPPPLPAVPSLMNSDPRSLETSKIVNMHPALQHPGALSMDAQLDESKQERAPCVSYFPQGVHMSTKELRDVMRKKTNNARERMRVKSMNIEYKRLENLIRKFVPMEKQPTRLQILKYTIESIFTLEKKLNASLRETRERKDEEREVMANCCTSSRAQKVRKQSTSSSVPSVISYGTSPEDINASCYYNL